MKRKADPLRPPSIGQIRGGIKGERGLNEVTPSIEPEEEKFLETSPDPERSKTKVTGEKAATWDRMSAEERARVVAERSKAKTGTKIGQVRVENRRDDDRPETRETKEVKVKRKRNQQWSAEGWLA